MAKVAITESYLTDIADAIRSKNNSIQTYKPSEMASAISEISGGSINYKMGVLRDDAVLVSTYSYDKYINADEKITIPTYSTTSSTVLASETLEATYTLDYANYNYFILERALTIPEYNVTSKAKGRVEYHMSSYFYEICEVPENNFTAIIDGTTKYTSRTATLLGTGFNRLVYWSSGTAITPYSTTAYGCAQAIVAPTLSSGIVTFKTPNFIMRGHTTYFTSTYYNALTDIRIQFLYEVYRSPKGTANLNGWTTYTQAQHIIDCVNNNNNHKLT